MSALQTRTNLAWLLAAAVVTVLALPGVSEARWRGAQGACQAASAQVGHASRAQLLRGTLCLMNVERARRGLPQLRLNRRLSRAATRHSRDMVRRHYFSHDSLGGASFVDRVRRTGYLRSVRSWNLGENLAWGSGNRGTPEQIVRAWMKSPGHRSNILTGRFREVGIGVSAGAPVRVDGVPAATYTTNFGARS